MGPQPPQRVNVGDEIVLSAPFGDVVLEYICRPVVLSSAGIGITPMAGMLSHLAKTGAQQKVLLLHANVSAESFALREQLAEDLKKLPEASSAIWLLTLSGPTEAAAGAHGVFPGFMNVGDIDLPEDAEYYFCGPVAFMQSVRTTPTAPGVPPKDIQYGVFGPDLWLADSQ